MKTENQILLGGYRKISPSSILMLRADTNYTITYLVDGTHFLSATTLGILEERLKEFNFYRTHRSTLINLKYISFFESMSNHLNLNAEIRINDSVNVPVARRKIPEFIKRMQLMAIS
ncbi:MAG: LytTR family DNA-binding domain-containing protein [Bacteroidota bacterium]